MATSKKHKILLPPLVLALTYLIWQIYLMLDPREHQPFQLPLSLHNNVTQNLFIDHSSPMHKQYHLLLQQYQITRLKRLIE